MWLVAGLGNPGKKYERNRHNIGFLAVDSIAREYHATAYSKKFTAEIAEASVLSEKILLLKPQTFMNLSGEAIAKAAHFYKIPPEQIMVFYDELDLPIGKLRVKTGGGNGGHNGLKSMDQHLGVNYKRIRIGIDRPTHKGQVTSYVLGDFGKVEYEQQEQMLQAITKYFPLLLANDDAGFMNKIALAFPK